MVLPELIKNWSVWMITCTEKETTGSWVVHPLHYTWFKNFTMKCLLMEETYVWHPIVRPGIPASSANIADSTFWEIRTPCYDFSAICVWSVLPMSCQYKQRLAEFGAPMHIEAPGIDICLDRFRANQYECWETRISFWIWYALLFGCLTKHRSLTDRYWFQLIERNQSPIIDSK